jgi:stearoyl-CoA desaturase (delta-9 desaturase)
MQDGFSGNVVNGVVRWSPLKSAWWFGMTGTALVGGALAFSWTAFGLFILLTASVLLFGHSLGSHRKLIHDSFACPKWLEYILVYMGVQVGLSGPLGLIAQHDLRDHAQRQANCHSYLRHGESFWRDGWWQLHCELDLDPPPDLAPRAELADDRFYRFLERTWMLQQIPPAVLLYLIGGWAFVVWGVCARIAAGVTGHWLIGYFAHNHGTMHHLVDGAAVQGHNVRFAALLTMGESWHNNHHAYPGSARLGLYAGEWDPGWWVLTVLERAGLVWELRLPSNCAARPELRILDDMTRPERTLPALRPAELIHAVSCASLELLARGRRITLTGPCVSISADGMQRLVGRHTTVIRSPTHRRLFFTHGGRAIAGLPALLIAIGSSNLASAVLAALLLPPATMVELLRGQLRAYPETG